MKETRCYFFDFYNTLSSDHYWSNLAPDLRNAVNNFIFTPSNSILKNWMLGLMSSEDVCRHAARAISCREDVLFTSLVESCSMITIDTELLKILAALHSRSHTVLVTGNMDCFSRFVEPQLQLTKYFDCVLNSADIGYHKTDHEGRIFLEAAQKLGVNVGNCVLYDDDTESGDVFSRLGGSYRWVSGPTDTLSKLKKPNSTQPRQRRSAA